MPFFRTSLSLSLPALSSPSRLSISLRVIWHGHIANYIRSPFLGAMLFYDLFSPIKNISETVWHIFCTKANKVNLSPNNFWPQRPKLSHFNYHSKLVVILSWLFHDLWPWIYFLISGVSKLLELLKIFMFIFRIFPINWRTRKYTGISVPLQ